MENKNNYTAQIIGLSEIPVPLEIGKSYEIKITADCNSVTKQNNEDGTFTYKHKLKQLTAEIVKDNGEIIKVLDNKSQSKKLRGQLWAIGQEKGMDGQAFYEEQMTKIRHHLPCVLEYMESLERLK